MSHVLHLKIQFKKAKQMQVINEFQYVGLATL
jgi:hypothetical protein